MFLNNNFFIFFFMVAMGLVGLYMNKENLIQMLVSFEMISMGIIMMLGFMCTLNFSLFSLIMSILVTVVSASEVALGLILIMGLYKVKGSISVSSFMMK